MLKNSQKGMTIIEVVISLAILMVIMISASSLVGIVTKNKQFTHDKQGATLLGQEIIEQIQLTDSLKMNEESRYYFPLAGLNNLIKNDTNNNLVGLYTSDINTYQVEFRMERTELESLHVFIKNKNETQFTVQVEQQTFDIEKLEGLTITLDDNSIKFGNVLEILSDQTEIIIQFDDQIPITDSFELEATNVAQPQKQFNICLYQELTDVEKLTIIPTLSGDVVVSWKSNLDELYNYTLKLSKQNKLLFEAYGNKILTKDSTR